MSKKKWNVYLIHHSHTDIGYTERQDKIMRYHYDFIRQAIDILDEIHIHGKKEYEGFVWQCENYWQIENFYKMADEDYRSKLEHYVSTGEIGLSGNYLNMTDLVSEAALNESLERMRAYGEETGHPITAGMCADVDGLAWGYGDALYNHGVKYFYSGLHSHHGMFPLYKKVRPFYWETPAGNRILVWSGDHYQIGNDLFLAPNAGASYMIHDEYSPFMEQNLILNQSKENTEAEEMEILKQRLKRYLDNLEAEGYPYDLVPLPVSGAVTDNSPPSAGIASRIQELNRIYAGEIVFKMVNLEQFFHEVEENCKGIETFAGDWTDWWADGVGSTPSEVKIYREAVRKYELCRKLDPQNLSGDKELMEKTAEELMLYAEHTWGYSSSVSEPWESLVSALELKKGSYAVGANTCAAKNLDQILAARGEVSVKYDRPQVYTVCNPHPHRICTKACLYIELWEYVDGVRYDGSIPIEVIDVQTGEKLFSQVKRIARATQIEIEISMGEREEKRVRIQLADRIPRTVLNHAGIGAEGVEDLLCQEGFRRDEDQIETEHFLVRMKDGQGIYSIIKKEDQSELIRKDAREGAFAGVYEYTPMTESACETRRRMGRNRKSKATRRYPAMLTDRRITEKGDIYTALELIYSLEGTGMYTVLVKVYQHQPKIEAMVCIHKESRWEPENLYVSLPFTAGEESVTYLDKTGCIIRPGYDQLPGSCQDFYLIQNGVLWNQGEKNVALITRDAPLVSMGGLESKPVVLCSGNDRERNQSPVYSWVMNNYWETNFKVNLGGFYEFSYTLLADSGRSPKEMYQICEEENEGLLAYYTE